LKSTRTWPGGPAACSLIRPGTGGVLWAEAGFELYFSWLRAEQHGQPAPLGQVHGHASAWRWIGTAPMHHTTSPHAWRSTRAAGTSASTRAADRSWGSIPASDSTPTAARPHSSWRDTLTEPLTPAQARRIADLISWAPLDNECDRAHVAQKFATAMPETPWLDLIQIADEGRPTVHAWATQNWDASAEEFRHDRYEPLKNVIRHLLARRDTAAREALAPYAHAVLAWLDGHVTSLPSHQGPPTDETLELLQDLRQLNQGGLVTMNSQPGRPDQRAFLDVVTSPERAVQLAVLARRHGLWADAWPLAAPPTELQAIVVTREPWCTISFCRAVDPDDGTGLGVDTEVGEHIRGSVVQLVPAPTADQCWSVQVIDPVWDRQRALWDAVTAVTAQPEWTSTHALGLPSETP